VFLVGSRLWGSATFDSDYDFIIVHRCPTAKRPPHATLHNGEIDASAVHVDEFKKRVEDDHEFYELLCLWLPADYRWKDAPLPSSSSSSSSSKSSAKKKASPPPSSSSSTTSFVESIRRSFVLNPSRLYASIEEETARDWRVAQKFMEKGSPDRGKKILVHALRLLLLAIQLARDGTMHDLHAAQRFHRDVFFPDKTNKLSTEDEETWSHYNARYRPVFDDLRRQLHDLCATKGRPQQQQQQQQQQALRQEEKKDDDEEKKADEAVGQSRSLTPAAIASRIKAKGLEKLRWYCQFCGEQFLDEGGFKVCETTHLYTTPPLLPWSCPLTLALFTSATSRPSRISARWPASRASRPARKRRKKRKATTKQKQKQTRRSREGRSKQDEGSNSEDAGAGAGEAGEAAHSSHERLSSDRPMIFSQNHCYKIFDRNGASSAQNTTGSVLGGQQRCIIGGALWRRQSCTGYNVRQGNPKNEDDQRTKLGEKNEDERSKKNEEERPERYRAVDF
jgi:hypothetical protein